ncbi:GreA/GreB family transcription elongation factor [Rhizobium sp. PP-F2F-G48]|uniref:PIN domain-containing protein n=1 Tax=Rhizobium sp. PP-F2F-G48 TaxID=2135651 RepID=UPI001043CC2F|nr:GreA/GreB family elongation factor [Rhizobium sp. PP-F2F-G48]TCM51122.1 GreA/GreB family transcription elongation factor [Rhizobium sp. PP-F2F-G48]
MSLLAATQIPKPADEQAFERASVVLWRGLLNDPSVQRNGRRGQRQNGVDLFGLRDGNVDWHVGIQCKLKSEGHVLSEDEVRAEIKKALTFKPPLSEYYVITTAPDDVAMQELARRITRELAAVGTPMRVFVWGWNTLEERISEDAAARKAFDPTYTLFSEEILAETKSLSIGQEEARAEIATVTAGMMRVEAMLAARLVTSPGDSTVTVNAIEAHLDAEIDEYRDLLNSGKTLTAMPLLERLLARVGDTASGRILFRIQANIGHCLLALGRDAEAATMLLASYDHAPDEPKAVANKAFGLLLQGDWEDVMVFGRSCLAADPSNEWLAGYLVQAARFDLTVTDPLGLVPKALRETATVQIGWIDFVRRRGEPGEWWGPVRKTLAMHPTDPHVVQFAAEADLDEILTSQRFQRTRVLCLAERQRLQAATEALASQWDLESVTDGPLRTEDAALCGNLVVGLAALEEFPKALDIARQGLALASDDAELLIRAAMVAIEAGDEAFAAELLPRLPVTADSVVMKFRYHAERADWPEIVALFENNASLIPSTEEAIIKAIAGLAAVRIDIDDPEERRRRIAIVSNDAAHDPRASIVVADFARGEKIEDIADAAFEAALKQIDDDSPAADRLMVAHHANRRGDAAIVIGLLDGRVAEDHNSNELRMLARAFVNDSPIRQRALSFFARLPEAVREHPYYLHAEGLLHFNRGALSEAEAALRKAVLAEPDLDNYIALFSVLHRLDRGDEVKGLVEGIDLATVKGTPAQKMFLAQVMRKCGQGPRAIQYAYSVLQFARNDHKAALRYFGLIMMDPDKGLIPLVETVASDIWVRLENDRHERYAFLIEEGGDRPADDIVSPTHPMAAAALGLRVGEEFEMPVPLGGTRRWRVAEIKHKYLHALHDIMENFENRFPGARGFYKFTMQEGDIQPALDQIRRAAEGNRNRADLYLKNNCPISFVVAKSGHDTIRFVEYIRFLDFDIRACVGNEPERAAAHNLLETHRHSGAVLDAYTAWTVSTMDAFDVLEAVFGTLIVPQTVIDEIRTLRDDQETTAERSMTMTWHKGQYIRQEHTREDIAARRNHIVEQLTRIEAACEVRSVVAPDHPSEIASLISQSFGSYVLDAANLAGTDHLLVSEDMYYRQYAEACCAAKGLWLQAIFSFAYETGLIDGRRYVDLVVKLAWRRHGHLALNAATILAVLRAEDDQRQHNFEAVANFIGTQNADLQSHIAVATEFLNQLWRESDGFNLPCMQATSALLERIVRFRTGDWAFVLALLKRGCVATAQDHIDRWIAGHFLSAGEVTAATREIDDIAEGMRSRKTGRGVRKSISAPNKRKIHRARR